MTILGNYLRESNNDFVQIRLSALPGTEGTKIHVSKFREASHTLPKSGWARRFLRLIGLSNRYYFSMLLDNASNQREKWLYNRIGRADLKKLGIKKVDLMKCSKSGNITHLISDALR